MDDAFRDAVIDELYVHEERFAAPSLGIDAARVLAHALRARRIQLCWAGAVLLLWVGAIPLSQGLAGLYVLPVVLMALARFVRRAPVPQWLSRPIAFLLRWYGRISLTLTLLMFLVEAFGGTFQLLPWQGGLSDLFGYGDGYGSYGWSDGFGGPGDGAAAAGYGSGFAPVWIALLLPVAVAVIVGLQRGQFARVLAAELSRANFPDMLGDPAERFAGARFQRLRQRVRAEQHGPLVMYRPAEPFRGAGTAFRTWSLSVELRPRKDRKAEPLDNSAILARIVPLVAALRVPSPHGSPQAQAAVRDRLRELEMDECVFLPAEGLPHRGAAPYAPAAFEAHRAAAVEEGGEPRRHFLRIRVGGWNESIVTTVFVRVHTQGGMLMLEVAPHVLWSLRQLFQDADRLAHRYRHLNPFGKVVWALARTPLATGRAVSTLARGLWSVWRLATGGHGAALPDGPAASVRELGTDEEASLFQEMDVARYLRTIEQRVAAGVTTALREAGYETDEFERRVVHVAEGGVYVESAQGAVGIGDHNTVTNHTQRGSTTTEGARGGNG
ncbi:hypothetical protein [Streptomyces pinistramenti]|uniref:hypothetical protein n=1 Tax=Streptomyces pinistramenti TaxID=2884812 RepID=UPI001D08DA18|nr:hypothetical protein [Streptomyces pinistramenti]MCB5911765.1 hypothetical protein [Streptomyces pinistramenti]